MKMSITVCTGKLHRARVTGARLDYEGSITIDPLLMKAAGIEPFQLVHVNSLANAAHWETYVIAGTPGQGEICLNGCPARLFQPGDYVIILSLEQLTRQEAAKIEHRVVYLDADNQVQQVVVKTPTQVAAASARPQRPAHQVA
jgi:aspartate 1-decarboxylase